MRKFDSQSRGSRLCGYYAVAAAVSCCLRVDPTGCVYDENQLIESFHRFKGSDNELHEPFPYVSVKSDIRTVLEAKKPMLYCICQQPDNCKRMIKCTVCGKWFHEVCVLVSSSQLKDADKEWPGPCCGGGKRKQFQVRTWNAVN